MFVFLNVRYFMASDTAIPLMLVMLIKKVNQF